MKLINRIIPFNLGILCGSALCALIDPEVAIRTAIVASVTIWGFAATHFQNFNESERNSKKP